MLNSMNHKLLEIEREVIALRQLELMIEVPGITFHELQSVALGVRKTLRKHVNSLFSEQSFDILRYACLFGGETVFVTTTTFPDGSEETSVEVEHHPPSTELLLDVLGRFFPNELPEKAKVVADWVASGAIAPPQSLIDDFDLIEAKTLANM